eukprot:m.4329 g.4329  ORF g.4329 m.4329 type:complete len:312 (+) comp2958_c0_seq1:64-999(+)
MSETTRKRAKGTENGINGETNSSESENKVNSKYTGEGKGWPLAVVFAGKLLKRVNPQIGTDTGKSKIYSAWWISPEQTALELLIFFIITVHFTWQLLRGGNYLKGWDSNDTSGRELDVWDRIIAWNSVFHAVIMIVYKIKRGRLAFLLQPCNMWTILFIYVSFSRSTFSTVLFNFYLHAMWGSWLGALAADLRDYSDKKEILWFFTNHFTLIVFPLYHVARQTFPIFPLDSYATWMINCVLHYWVYFPFSLYTGWQIQYMMHPPTQLRIFGRWYRPLMCLIGYVLTYITCHGIAWYTHYTTGFVIPWDGVT